MKQKSRGKTHPGLDDTTIVDGLAQEGKIEVSGSISVEAESVNRLARVGHRKVLEELICKQRHLTDVSRGRPRGVETRKERRRTKLSLGLALKLLVVHELLDLADGGLDVRDNELVQVVVGVLVGDSEDLADTLGVWLVELVDVCKQRNEEERIN